MEYSNPILPGFHPDPSICFANGYYWLVTSTFEFFPGLPIYKSKDLLNWELIGHCLTTNGQLPLKNCSPSCGLWAPTIRYNEGLFYIVCSNITDGGSFLVTSKDPEKGWGQPIYIDKNGVDPSLFFDGEKVYYTSDRRDKKPEDKDGIYIAELDVSTGRFLTPHTFLSNGTGGLAVEGSHLYKISGYYYLLLAEGGTQYGHMITVFRSRNVYGPYESCPHNPILTHRDKFHEIMGTGHGDLICDTAGNWWVVFLAFRPKGGRFYRLGRETFLLPVEFEDGWPVVNGNKGAEMRVYTDRKIAVQLPQPDFIDDFSEKVLNKRYNFVYNPILENYILRDGCLTLKPGIFTLNDSKSSTFIGIRQQHFCCRVRIGLEFEPFENGDEAGLTVFRNLDGHYDWCIAKDGAKSVLRLRRKLSDIDYIQYEQVFENKKIVLEIISDETSYSFGFGTEEGQIKYAARANAKFLSTESCGGPFTGVYIGMYVAGKTNAKFRYFKYLIQK